MRILAASLCAALVLTRAEACTVKSAVDQTYFASIQSDGDRAEQSLKVLKQTPSTYRESERPKKVFNADGWPDHVRLSNIEPRFTCTACGRRGAEVRPKFLPARMGTG